MKNVFLKLLLKKNSDKIYKIDEFLKNLVFFNVFRYLTLRKVFWLSRTDMFCHIKKVFVSTSITSHPSSRVIGTGHRRSYDVVT